MDRGSEETVKVWYCNHYAMPPGAGGAERPVRLAEALRDAGEQVMVVAAGWHHLYREEPDQAPEVGEISRSDVGGIDFCLLGVTRYRGNGPGRLRNMRDYGAGLRKLEKKVAAGDEARPDVVIYSSPHPFGIPAVVKMANRLGAKFVLEVRDLWPQSLVQIAGVSSWHPLCLWAAHCVKVGHRAASKVIGVLPGVAAAAADSGFGLPEDRVAYLPNGGKLDSVDAPGENPYAEEFSVAREQGRMVVAYTGSLGIANSLEQILDLVSVEGVAERPYHFFLIGDGVSVDQLKGRIAAEKIDFVSILLAVEKKLIPAVLSDADAAVVTWKKLELYHYGVSPNKLFDYFGSGLPVFWIGDTQPDPVREADAGWSLEPNDSQLFHDTLVSAAATESSELTAMGERGREYLKKHHNWAELGQRFVNMCRNVAAGESRVSPK